MLQFLLHKLSINLVYSNTKRTSSDIHVTYLPFPPVQFFLYCAQTNILRVKRSGQCVSDAINANVDQTCKMVTVQDRTDNISMNVFNSLYSAVQINHFLALHANSISPKD